MTPTPMQRHCPQSATICISDSQVKAAARNAEAVVSRPAAARVEPPGLAFGRPDDKLREAHQWQLAKMEPNMLL
jgi:hypothetical protein